MTQTRTAADLVPWETALRIATAATPAGPRVPAGTRRSVVAALRRSVDDAVPWSGQITGLRAAARETAASTEVLVVDRPGFMRASAASLRAVLAGVEAPPSALVPRALAAGQVAGALGFLSTRLLGQVLPLVDGGPERTRLLLVAPNVLAIQRRLELDLLDLPAWVTLHEATHAIQLRAAPWLAGYLTEAMRGVVRGLVDAVSADGVVSGPRRAGVRPGSGTELSEAGAGVGERVWRVAGLLRQGGRGTVPDGAMLLDQMLEPHEQELLAELAAVLTVLEGHAEAVLDAVETSHMPSVHRLRAVLARSRRQDGGVGPGLGAGSLLHRLIGLEVKEAQYADGAAFVRAVVARAGHEGFNVVWASPENMPRPAEIARPGEWMERVGL